MYPLQGPTDENEPVAREHSQQNKINVLWAIPVTIGCYVVGFGVVSLLLDRELCKLKGLHLAIRFLQRLAEESGSRGIKLENRYNDIVNAMH